MAITPSRSETSLPSNSIPTKEELTNILGEYKDNVVVHEIDHTYSFGNQKHSRTCFGHAKAKLNDDALLGIFFE